MSEVLIQNAINQLIYKITDNGIWIEKCEINVTRHCNNHCAACNHASPLAEPYYMDPETLRQDLEAFKKVCHIGFLCLQGGEPLLHPKIIELMNVQGSSGIADSYGMLSNGRLLAKMPEQFFQKAGQLHYELRVSVYPNFDPNDLPMDKATQYKFEIRPNTTIMFWRLFNKEEHKDGGKSLWDSCKVKTCYTLHEGYFFHCPLAAFFPQQFHGKEFGLSGLPLADITPDKLKAYLDQAEPDWMCAHCAGTPWGVMWHEQTNKEEWMKEATV